MLSLGLVSIVHSLDSKRDKLSPLYLSLHESTRLKQVILLYDDDTGLGLFWKKGALRQREYARITITMEKDALYDLIQKDLDILCSEGYNVQFMMNDAVQQRNQGNSPLTPER